MSKASLKKKAVEFFKIAEAEGYDLSEFTGWGNSKVVNGADETFPPTPEQCAKELVESLGDKK